MKTQRSYNIFFILTMLVTFMFVGEIFASPPDPQPRDLTPDFILEPVGNVTAGDPAPMANPELSFDYEEVDIGPILKVLSYVPGFDAIMSWLMIWMPIIIGLLFILDKIAILTPTPWDDAVVTFLRWAAKKLRKS